jgi:hypothetical protein
LAIDQKNPSIGTPLELQQGTPGTGEGHLVRRRKHRAAIYGDLLASGADVLHVDMMCA